MIFDEGSSDAESLVRELLRNVSDAPTGLWTQVMNKISDPLTPLVNPALVPDALFGWGDDGLDVLDWGPDDDSDASSDDHHESFHDDDLGLDDDDTDFDDF
ncbi:hypothetical protein [Smaragdicoccus niigatensis]|uniref:hypothetical protein n=1 Tax=Smaragdicoccus niigatensis TaxID=359359 RepID=UPI0003688810|nr:hypothetical protein [Smaragdicoccus niigatensis]